MASSVSSAALAAPQTRVPDLAQDDMVTLMTELTVDGDMVSRLLKLSRNTTYKALRNGEIPSVRIGHQYRVPTAKLRDMLGLPHPPSPTPIAA